jgi:hypothetical protein
MMANVLMVGLAVGYMFWMFAPVARYIARSRRTVPGGKDPPNYIPESWRDDGPKATHDPACVCDACVMVPVSPGRGVLIPKLRPASIRQS